MPNGKHYYTDDQVTLHLGDALQVAKTLPDGSVDCIVTSPPYFGLRDYGTEGQYGLEKSPAEYVERMRGLFAELRRVLADDGTLWLNIGDSYSNKHLAGIPWTLALALKADSWILRNAVIWSKPNAMPEGSAYDRLSNCYEHVFLFSKSTRYWFNLDAIRDDYSDRTKARAHYAGRDVAANDWSTKAGRKDGNRARGLLSFSHDGLNPNGRNPGDVWSIPTRPFPGAHFACFPLALPQRCILAGCKPGGTVLDPFSGSGTTGLAAQRLGRKYVGIDLNADYLKLSLETRLRNQALDFGEGA